MATRGKDSKSQDLIVGTYDLATGATQELKSFWYFYVDGSRVTPFVFKGKRWFCEPKIAMQGGGTVTNVWSGPTWTPAYTIGGQATVAAAVSVCKLQAP